MRQVFLGKTHGNEAGDSEEGQKDPEGVALAEEFAQKTHAPRQKKWQENDVEHATVPRVMSQVVITGEEQKIRANVLQQRPRPVQRIDRPHSFETSQAVPFPEHVPQCRRRHESPDCRKGQH